MDSQKKKVSEVAGCLIEPERTFMFDYASNLYTGEGEIVDLGCFLGSSTYPLAAGLEQNSNVANKSKRIFAYDRFEWNAWMERPASRYQLGKKYQENECFVDEFERQMGDKLPQINVVKGDLTKLSWPAESFIEYLFVDSMKDWSLCNNIIPGFYPAMKPGVSFLHHQDYVWYQTYWIHLTMYRMKDYFEPVDHKYLGPSRVFKYTQQLPAELIQGGLSVQDFDADEINAAFDHALSITHEPGHANITGARITALLDRGCQDEAAQVYSVAKSTYPGAFDKAPLLNIKARFEPETLKQVG